MWTDGQVVFSYTVYGVPHVDWVFVHVTQYGGQYMCTVVLWIVPVFELDGLWDFVCHPGFAAWHVQTVYRFSQSRIQLTLYHAFSWTKANVTELLGVLESAHSISYTASIFVVSLDEHKYKVRHNRLQYSKYLHWSHCAINTRTRMRTGGMVYEYYNCTGCMRHLETGVGDGLHTYGSSYYVPHRYEYTCWSNI